MFTKNVLTSSIQGAGFELEYLVIAGGGGGERNGGGGGGAGGYRSSIAGEDSGGGASAESPFVANLGVAYTVTIGAGGVGGIYSPTSLATDGSSSVFGTVTSVGGGKGGIALADGNSGGSGGGGGRGNASGGAGTSGQGFAGGTGGDNATPNYPSGGGGGAGAVGGDAVGSTTAGDGGDGVQSTVTGVNTYRAGGGGGNRTGVGGLGGGGDCGGTGGSGTVNTGSGGGAGDNLTSPYNGGAGGSGVVIIKVPRKIIAEFSAGVSYNYIPVDGFHVYEITAAGASDTVTFSDGSDTPVTIDESLRFNDDDTAYLARTPSVASNRKTWTWSGWVKRANLGSRQTLWSARDGTSGHTIELYYDQIDAFKTGTGAAMTVLTDAVFRDVSAWYNIVFAVDTTQATASDRFKIYINGKLITSFSTASYPALNADLEWNNTKEHDLGRRSDNVFYFDGYMADVYFIDGQALDPSNFGHADDNGVWQPIAYSGTYGTNGFHLEFADNSTAAALGTDTSGNGNDWTPSGITTDDQVTDTPSVNYATLNPLDNNGTLSDGNLKLVTAVSTTAITKATFAIPQSGKWYFEVLAGSSNGYIYIGDGAANVANSVLYRGLNGDKRIDGTFSSYGASYTSGDLIGVAVNVDDGEINFYKNNVDQGTISYTIAGKTLFPAISDDSSSLSFTATANFGQLPFTYTPPTGFVALSSANLPTPTIADGKEHFDIALYTGTGKARTVRGFEFQPDFVWIKNRSGANSHILSDAVRGAGVGLASEANVVEFSIPTDFQAFLSNGFTVGYAGTNITGGNGQNYVAWNWNAGGSTVTNTDGTVSAQVRANTTAGFSIATYNPGLTGAGQSCTVGHGLSQAPEIIITKSRSHVYNWWTFTTIIDGSVDYLALNLTTAKTDDAYSLAITSSTFTQNYAYTGVSTSHVAYCFHSVEGFSKLGTYTGNGSTDGPFIYTGFRPAFVIIKRTDAAGYNWIMMDSARSPYNLVNSWLYANLANAQDTSLRDDVLSNGFKVRQSGAGINASGGTYIYMAFAENPFKTARAR